MTGKVESSDPLCARCPVAGFFFVGIEWNQFCQGICEVQDAEPTVKWCGIPGVSCVLRRVCVNWGR